MPNSRNRSLKDVTDTSNGLTSLSLSHLFKLLTYRHYTFSRHIYAVPAAQLSTRTAVVQRGTKGCLSSNVYVFSIHSRSVAIPYYREGVFRGCEMFS